MKYLFLLRHGKSSWDHPELKDHDRPLTPRGEDAARLMGGYLKKQVLVPELVICSTAVRAKSTWSLFSEAMGNPPPAIYEKSIYMCFAKNLIELISKSRDSLDRIMIVGHNPTMEDTVEHLTADAFPYPKYSTAGLALLEIPCTRWQDIDKHKARLQYFMTPKML